MYSDPSAIQACPLICSIFCICPQPYGIAKMWYKYFDKIYLINLPERKDRYLISMWELSKYAIPYQTVRAVKHADGRDGLYQTMRKVFEQAVADGHKNVLIFEDDLKFVHDPAPVMESVLKSLPADYDLFYLGCNLVKPPAAFFAENLLPVSRALSTHAVAYSRPCMERILSLPKMLPYDLLLANVIQPAGKSYCSYPFLVSQYPGHSDIMNVHTDWTLFLDHRFEQHTKHLNVSA